MSGTLLRIEVSTQSGLKYTAGNFEFVLYRDLQIHSGFERQLFLKYIPGIIDLYR